MKQTDEYVDPNYKTTDDEEEAAGAARPIAQAAKTTNATAPKRHTGATPNTAAKTTIKPSNMDPKKALHSPDFIVKDLPGPAFKKAMRNQNVNVMAKILPDGQQKLTCEYENRDKVKSWLTENKVYGTKSTCNHERIGSIIAKGIHVGYSEEEVTQFLEEHVDFKVKKVCRFQEAVEGRRPFHWWIITTHNREQIKWFMKTYQIKWENYESKRSPRCFNCQQYRHLSNNCFRDALRYGAPTRSLKSSGNP